MTPDRCQQPSETLMPPRLLISALRKSSGKTTLSIGVAAAFAARGLEVRTFKKGPDFIDPMWLAKASGAVCRNLDFFMMGTRRVRDHFIRHAQGCGLALIEGNHGYFDGQDLEGGDCAAALAELLQTPVVLVVDCKGASRGVAALVQGHLDFPGGQWIRGVILNHVASPRHEKRLRQALARYCPVPVVGCVPHSGSLSIEERHLGLQPVAEEERLLARIQEIRDGITPYVDWEALLALARSAPPLTGSAPPMVRPVPASRLRVAMAMDQSTHFYYPENLEALREAGVELLPFSLLNDASLPDADGLYIGGGFPEMFMERLAGNRGLLDQIRDGAAAGLPVYAECGGVMVLAEQLRWGDREARMIGALSIELRMEKRPVGYGYMEIEGSDALSWPGAGRRQACHEFHHSRVTRVGEGVRFAFRVTRGFGVDGKHDGLLYRNILASYAHVHAQAAPDGPISSHHSGVQKS
ncbi:MAG: cobyrinate a,c-diamide synthase [Magnetococcales bacterium]|nr:cobyrinate a,c-diamide synthase [Magnetococcales bacterium]